MNILKRYIREVVDEQLGEIKRITLAEIAKEIDPDKMYLLVVPTDIPKDALERYLAPFRSLANIVVLQADNVRLLEFSNGK